MTRFIEILHPKPRLVDGVEAASPHLDKEERTALFAQFVEETPGLHHWTEDTALKNSVKRLVVIIANWSAVDLRCMDELVAAATMLEQRGVYIEIYDYDELRSVEHLNTIIPDLGSPVNSPFVGIREGNRQIACAHGLRARQLITKYIHQHEEMDAL